MLPGGRWVALRSAYGGGFVEVLPRSQADEYVARVARDGQLSFRSLLLLRRDAVWSHAVGGYINLRGAQEGDAREHLRAHGNDAPFRPLRDLAASARFGGSNGAPSSSFGQRAQSHTKPYRSSKAKRRWLAQSLASTYACVSSSPARTVSAQHRNSCTHVGKVRFADSSRR